MTLHDRVQEASRKERSPSQLLRAREMPGFALGDSRVDVRRWPVYCCDAVLVGSVESMFVDVHTKAVRYLGIALRDPETKVATGSVLVPIGAAARPGKQPVVVLRAIASRQLAAAPRIRARPITRADEDAALVAYGMSALRDARRSRESYARPEFAQHHLFGAALGEDADGPSQE